MLGVVMGTSAVKVWMAIGSAVFLLGLSVLAYFLPRYLIGSAVRAGFVILGVGLGAITAWALLDYTPSGVRMVRAKMASALLDYTHPGEPRSERRSLELRAVQLNAQALAPGSPLACLDGLAGETVDAACEKEIFTSPANVAAATSFVAHRIELLAAMLAYEKRGTEDIGGLLRPLRRSLEADRFGFLAHVLALRDGCTSENCKELALLDDPARVRANLSAQTFDHYVEHYAEIWPKVPDSSVVDAVQQSPRPPHKTVNIDFPTAASIPPVSIMSPEPTGPVLGGAATNRNQQSSTTEARRTRKSASSPQPLTQPGATNATEPIWPEPLPPSPAMKPAAAAEPMQLAPPSPSASSMATAQ